MPTLQVEMCGHTVFRRKGEMIGKELVIQTGDPGEPPTPYAMRKRVAFGLRPRRTVGFNQEKGGAICRDPGWRGC